MIGAVALVVTAVMALVPNLKGDDDTKGGGSTSPSSSSSTSPASRQKVSINPTSGPARTTDIEVRATGFLPDEKVKIEFAEGSGLTTFEGPYGSENTWRADRNGVVSQKLAIPDVCCAGGKLIVRVTSVERHGKASDQTLFTLA